MGYLVIWRIIFVLCLGDVSLYFIVLGHLQQEEQTVSSQRTLSITLT